MMERVVLSRPIQSNSPLAIRLMLIAGWRRGGAVGLTGDSLVAVVADERDVPDIERELQRSRRKFSRVGSMDGKTAAEKV